MQLAERPPIKRDPREAFDYATLFDGRPWTLTPNDYGGRTQRAAYTLIRQTAWRRGLRFVIEFDGPNLIIQIQQEHARG